MPKKKRGNNKGKPLVEWCDENGEHGTRLLLEYKDKQRKVGQVSYGSNYKALWRCVHCRTEWRTEVRSRTTGKNIHPTGCPECKVSGGAIKHATATDNFLTWCEENGQLGEKLRLEWCDDNDKKPTDVMRGSNYKAKWKCSIAECGHTWKATVASRTKSFKPTGCPKCHPPYANLRKRQRNDA
jgi:hypothetical protein